MSHHVPERVLVVGSGSIAQRHVRNLLGLGVAQVIVQTARDASGVESFASERVSISAETPADVPAVAVIANDTNRHLATATALVERGVHVLIEKPLASEPSDALDALVHRAAELGVKGRVAYNLRFLGCLGVVRDTIAAGTLGTPLFARIEVGQWLPDWRPNRPLEELYSASETRGGGVALDLSHEVDYMTMIFGMPSHWQVATSRTGALPIQAADVFEGTYTFRSGFMCSVHLDYLERIPRRRLRLVGSGGVAECDVIGRRLTLSSNAGETRAFDDPELFDVQRTYQDELRSFFAEVAGEPQDLGVSLPSLAEGRDLLALLSDSPTVATEGACS